MRDAETEGDYASIHVNDVETAEGWLNKLAREAPGDHPYPRDYRYEDVIGLVERVGKETLDRKAELRQETTLSEREASVVSLKEAGLTHRGIELVLTYTDDEPVQASTIDEYARRAREKYLTAQRTESYLEDTFDTSAANTSDPSSDRTPITIGNRTFPAGEYVGPDEKKPGAMTPDSIFFSFDTDELLETHEAGALSLVTSDAEIETPDGTFAGRVVDVGVDGDGNVGVFIETDETE